MNGSNLSPIKSILYRVSERIHRQVSHRQTVLELFINSPGRLMFPIKHDLNEKVVQEINNVESRPYIGDNWTLDCRHLVQYQYQNSIIEPNVIELAKESHLLCIYSNGVGIGSITITPRSKTTDLTHLFMTLIVQFENS